MIPLTAGFAGLDDYFGPWAISQTHATGLASLARSLDFDAHRSAHLERVAAERAARTASGDGSQYRGRLTSDGVALIELRGTMMKSASSIGSSTGTVDTRREVRAARADSRVRGLMMLIESPGGAVAGTAELADDVRDAATVKPTWAYGEDLMASAAYWVGSQASRIGANRTAFVGSLGTISILYDMSKAFAAGGIQAHVFSTGEFKGAGAAGTVITDAQRAYFQSLINETNAHFVAAVNAGRKKDLRSAFDGRVHLAQASASAGLIDAVCSFDDFYGQFVQQLGSRPAGGVSAAAGQVQHASTDLGALFVGAMKDHTRAHGGSQTDAMVAVAKARPDLHRAYVLVSNQRRPRR